jgi:hypothetical protein
MYICVKIFVMCLFTRGLSLRRDVGYLSAFISRSLTEWLERDDEVILF